ncbi:uncharacterized protein RAG0_09828 [Rhynchosporium agropyri]|uniref:Uncharacterized protein n=1 Tax=Rhynchosporium agropyri TaxID=914238 RepID=A0A1E1KX72_9HELO|nr:uncharacterized protein RAG0_09828 [Rhynchosporium agropyri]
MRIKVDEIEILGSKPTSCSYASYAILGKKGKCVAMMLSRAMETEREVRRRISRLRPISTSKALIGGISLIWALTRSSRREMGLSLPMRFGPSRWSRKPTERGFVQREIAI